jgi:exopolysaccharide production protein ExoZ
LVLLQHAVFFAGQTEGMDMLSFRRVGIGMIGVLLFFMISGFVMAMQTGQTPLRFALHRILRIYPGYLLALAAGALLILAFYPAGALNLNFDLSLLLLPSGKLSSGFHVPYWTLIYEMFFYFLLFLMISLRFRSIWYATFMVAWTLAILLAPTIGIRNSNWIFTNATVILFSPFNLFFIGGFLLFGALHGGRRLAFALWLAIVLAELLWRGAVASPFNAMVIVAGAALIALATLLPRIPWPPLLIRLGDWSYGLYLMHLPIVYLLYLLLKDGPGFWPALAILLGAGLAAGGAFGLLEHRLHRDRMRPLADRLSSRLAPKAA